MTTTTRQGLAYGMAAYGLWGIVPFYFAPLMQRVRPQEVVAHRVVWSLVFLLPIVILAGRWRDVAACFRRQKLIVSLLISSVLIAGNWLVYILCVADQKIVHASLGYFLTPLVSVFLGRVFFGERLRLPQWLAVILATGGVASMIVAAGEWPWLGLTLAVTFGFYGLVRKQAPVDGLVGLTIETLLLAPIAATFLLKWGWADELVFGTQSRGLDLLIACSGVVTALPLLCFGQAARRLPLTALGFFQYLSPSLQFVLAVVIFGEPLNAGRIGSFALIWFAIAVFVWDSWRRYRQPQAEKDVTCPSADGPTQ